MVLNPVNNYDLLENWVSWIPHGALTVADELQIFGLLNEGGKTVQGLADALFLPVRGLTILTNILWSNGFIEKWNGLFFPSEYSNKYLLRSSQYYVGDIIRSKRMKDGYAAVKEMVSKKVTSHGMSITNNWERGKVSIEEAKYFTSLMESMIVPYGELMAKSSVFKTTGTIVDVGAGSGAVSRAIARAHPEPKFLLFDLPEVCTVSKTLIEKAKDVADRIDYWPGDFFHDKWPTKPSVIQFSNIFHDWPLDKCQFLAKRSFETLPTGGKIVLHEMLMSEEGPSDRLTVYFDFLMYINHSAQQFTFTELKDILSINGFGTVKKEVIPSSPFTLVVGIKE